MLNRAFKSLLKNHNQISAPLHPFVSLPSFCWKPEVPKYAYRYEQNFAHMPHPIWDLNHLAKIKQTHREPKDFRDRVALRCVKLLRTSFDIFSGFTWGKHNEATYLRRFIFLETIAGVPGMLSGMARHMASLRSLKSDHGWIHHLLEEAENERMHLFMFLEMRQPGYFFRLMILGAQGVFICAYTAAYILSSKGAHRFTGYLEEEAVKTYTHALKELDDGLLPEWQNLKASQKAIDYWNLGEGATFRDMLMAIRADEAMHREFNHHFADVKEGDKLDLEYTVEEVKKESVKTIVKEEKEAEK